MTKGLPKPRDRDAHHAALPYDKVSAFIHAMRASDSSLSARLAFEFLILTATRTSEVCDLALPPMNACMSPTKAAASSTASAGIRLSIERSTGTLRLDALRTERRSREATDPTSSSRCPLLPRFDCAANPEIRNIRSKKRCSQH
ncbi:hypothetical protein CHELA40_10680 [Chelatococcus asaccharovorans]|nr:hypothetical protein CHELA40_10680 [Chelatococcus asaccharovorans]CAH1686277.1 hypothetical protein CHELA17_64926 [Chelatococcus asaccharovorans]